MAVIPSQTPFTHPDCPGGDPLDLICPARCSLTARLEEWGYPMGYGEAPNSVDSMGKEGTSKSAGFWLTRTPSRHTSRPVPMPVMPRCEANLLVPDWSRTSPWLFSRISSGTSCNQCCA